MKDAHIISESLIYLAMYIGVVDSTLGDEDLQVRILEELSSEMARLSPEAKRDLAVVARRIQAQDHLSDIDREFISDFWLDPEGCLAIDQEDGISR